VAVRYESKPGVGVEAGRLLLALSMRRSLRNVDGMLKSTYSFSDGKEPSSIDARIVDLLHQGGLIRLQEHKSFFRRVTHVWNLTELGTRSIDDPDGSGLDETLAFWMSIGVERRIMVKVLDPRNEQSPTIIDCENEISRESALIRRPPFAISQHVVMDIWKVGVEIDRTQVPTSAFSHLKNLYAVRMFTNDIRQSYIVSKSVWDECESFYLRTGRLPALPIAT